MVAAEEADVRMARHAPTASRLAGPTSDDPRGVGAFTGGLLGETGGASALLEAIRDDLGFDTASLFIRTGDGWELLERRGPQCIWHVILDPGLLEGSSDTAGYPDVRVLPGIGGRLAAMGCISVGSIGLPEGGRLLLDACHPVADGWISRIGPYVELLALMAGPAWPVGGGSMRGHDEVAVLRRVFSACHEALARPAATTEDLLALVRRALRADEAYLLAGRGADWAVVADPAQSWLRPGPLHAVLTEPAQADRDLDPATLRRLALELSISSRAVAGAFGREDGDTEILVAGWAEGPALSLASMTVAAGALSTARAALETRARTVSALVDKERTRIAFALHDGLTQTVTGAVLELEALRKAIERDPAEAIQTIDHAKTEIRRALAELRGILFDLSHAEPQELPPAEPLTRYVEDVVRRWRLPARVAVQGDLGSVPPRILSVAYVVVREALANAAKHAASRNVTVRLAVTARQLLVTVGDGGPGFTPKDQNTAREAHHMGLDLLRRRVHEAGGQLRVESTPGRGTRVVARLPIEGVAS
jgi:signal transduction histidine kinase